MRAEADIAVEPETGAFARRTARDFCSVSTHWLAFENVAVQYRPVGNQGAPKATQPLGSGCAGLLPEIPQVFTAGMA
ncbi:hypothetical protein ILFOPFJJ_02440 [Ensifer psoraleae]|uniref:hypothetical protein n=1 Tax=Sinorhizobium psoraleae TaxID=520838 RepID=UPI001568C6D8|nr:hypothetical protein [Sinorhizobium psoraleae]NRP71553.1 hypothetical protein [Sinorhizobium psoraleae]